MHNMYREFSHIINIDEHQCGVLSAEHVRPSENHLHNCSLPQTIDEQLDLFNESSTFSFLSVYTKLKQKTVPNINII